MSKDLTQKLNGSLEDKVDWLIAAIQKMDERLQSVEAKVDTAAIDMHELKTRLDRLETKVDERLKDTRPMWEAVQSQLSELKESQEQGFRRLDRVFDEFAGDLGRLRGDYRGLEKQVDKIEKRLTQ